MPQEATAGDVDGRAIGTVARSVGWVDVWVSRYDDDRTKTENAKTLLSISL